MTPECITKQVMAVLDSSTSVHKIKVHGVAAVPALVKVLESSVKVHLRSRAAWALGAVGADAKPAMKALGNALLHDNEADVRRSSAMAIADIVAAGADLGENVKEDLERVARDDSDNSVHITCRDMPDRAPWLLRTLS